jgi:hypothetical protein
MDIWITRCRKKAKCRYCGQPIVKDNPMVKGKLWKRDHWPISLYWHPNCYIEQGIAEMEKRTIIETRGRRPLPIDDDAREKRTNILKRRASVIQRLKKETDHERILHLVEMLDNLKEEIKPLGGVPKGW